MAVYRNTRWKILENFLEQVQGDELDSVVLSEIVSFCSDSNEAIRKGDDTCIRVDTIEKPIITSKGWYV